MPAERASTAIGAVCMYVGGQVGTLSRCQLSPCYLYQVSLVGGDFTKNGAPSLAKGPAFVLSTGYRQHRKSYRRYAGASN